MSHWTHQTEHCGAKNGGGFRGTRAEAKAASKVGRRALDRAFIEEGLDEIVDEEVSARLVEAEAERIAQHTFDEFAVHDSDLYIVEAMEPWEAPKRLLITASKANAIEVANQAALDPNNYYEVILITMMDLDTLDVPGDYETFGQVFRHCVPNRRRDY